MAKRRSRMDFEYSEKVHGLREELMRFMDEHVYPNEKTFHEQLEASEDRWQTPPIMDELRRRPSRPGSGICSCPTPTSARD